MKLEQRVIGALRSVMDPEMGRDVWSMRLVRDLLVGEDGRVRLTFRPSSTACPLGFSLAVRIKEAVGKVPGVSGVDLRVQGFDRAQELDALLRRMDPRGP